MQWLKLFDDRQQKEIEFAKLYANNYAHGTDGHNAKIIIAKMAGLLDDIKTIVDKDDFDEEVIDKLLDLFKEWEDSQ